MKTREVTSGLVRHPLSAAWGDMLDSDLEELRADIEANGLRRPVVVINGNEVIDGWQRARACQYGAPIPITVVDYPKGIKEAYAFIRSEHARRSLTASQKAAAIIACHAWLDNGSNQHSGGSVPGTDPKVSAREMAEEAGVSESTIERAKAAERAGLGDAVRNGEMSAKAAAKIAKGDDGPPEPTPLEKARTEILELQMTLSVQEESIRELLDSVESYAAAGLAEDKQKIEFDKLKAEKRALESQLREKTALVNQWQSETLALRKKLKKLEAA